MVITAPELSALPVGAEFTVTSACPACGLRNHLRVKVILRVLPRGTYALAGTQDKVAARRGYRYHCDNCGSYGPADPK